MAITRSTGALLGTDESTGVSVASNAMVATTSANTGGANANNDVDVLGDNTSVGDLWLYAVVTSTVTAGSLDITINNRRLSGQAYARTGISRSLAPTNGTQKIPLGRIPASRYMAVSCLNNATGASATVAVLFELEKLS